MTSDEFQVVIRALRQHQTLDWFARQFKEVLTPEELDLLIENLS